MMILLVQGFGRNGNIKMNVVLEFFRLEDKVSMVIQEKGEYLGIISGNINQCIYYGEYMEFFFKSQKQSYYWIVIVLLGYCLKEIYFVNQIGICI